MNCIGVPIDGKFRAVGHGDDTGLAGIATNFGITVDEDPPELAQPAPPAVDTDGPPMWRAARHNSNLFNRYRVRLINSTTMPNSPRSR